MGTIWTVCSMYEGIFLRGMGAQSSTEGYLIHSEGGVHIIYTRALN